MPLPDRLSFLRSRWNWLLLVWSILPFAIRPFPLAGEIQYEFAAIVALAASLLSAAIPLLAPSIVSSASIAPDAERLWQLAPRILALSLLPLGIYLLLLPFSQQCGIDEGVSWYFLLVVPSSLIGMILGASVAALVERRWLRVLCFLAIWSLSLFRGGYEALDGPHIFLYAWQVGFFPGGSWDAELPIPALLLVYRLWHLLVAVSLASVVAQIVRVRSGEQFRPGTVMPAVALAALSLLVLPERTGLGLTRSEAWLRAELGDSLRTRFTTIYYDAASADSLDLWRAVNYADFHIESQSAELGLRQDQLEPITLYLYSSAAEQKRLVGTASASFTKPWKRMIHQTFERVGSTLEHELVHVMMEPFGNPLGVSMSQGLLEGSAVALEDDRDWYSIHEDAAELYRFEMAPPPEKIMGVGGFTAQRASVAYLIAGSFSRWLIDTYGMRRYLEAFAWGDFDKAYSRPLSALSDEYLRFIETKRADDYGEVDSFRLRSLRYLYGGGSFFYQRCLRRLGVLNAEGFRALAEERYDEALDRFRASMDEGITYSARGGVLRTLHGKGAFRELLDSMATYDRDTASYPLLPYLIERGDAYWALGDRRSAEAAYARAANHSISRATSTRALLRLFFLYPYSRPEDGTDSIGPVGRLMNLYFTRPMSQIQRLETLDRAHGLAEEPGERMILSLMKATILAPTLPRTSAAIVREAFGDSVALHRYYFSDSSLHSPGFMTPVNYLLYGLRDALLYDALATKPRGSEPLHITGAEFGYVGLKLFNLSLSSPSRFKPFQEEAFARYLERHAILP